MPTTTKDCKDFIADFIKHNPAVISSLFGGLTGKIVASEASNPTKWKRDHKCKPGAGNYEFDEYGIYDKNVKVNRVGYDILPKKPATDFVSERGLVFDPASYEDQIKFVVLEDVDGNLYLGDYIGD